MALFGPNSYVNAARPDSVERVRVELVCEFLAAARSRTKFRVKVPFFEIIRERLKLEGYKLYCRNQRPTQVLMILIYI